MLAGEHALSDIKIEITQPCGHWRCQWPSCVSLGSRVFFQDTLVCSCHSVPLGFRAGKGLSEAEVHGGTVCRSWEQGFRIRKTYFQSLGCHWLAMWIKASDFISPAPGFLFGGRCLIGWYWNLSQRRDEDYMRCSPEVFPTVPGPEYKLCW